MKDTKKFSKAANLIQVAAMLAPVGIQIANSSMMALADDASAGVNNTGSTTAGNTSGNGASGALKNETYTDIGGGVHMWLLGKAANQGNAYMYCMDADREPAAGTQTFNKVNQNGYTLDKVSNIIACGLAQPGHEPLCPDLKGLSTVQQQAVTQIAVWDALGQGGDGQLNGNGAPSGDTVDSLRDKAGLGGKVSALINYAASHQANQAVMNVQDQENGKAAIPGADQAKQQLQQAAQQEAQQQANDAMNSWKTSAQSSLQSAMTSAADSQYNQLTQKFQSTALTMIHFTQEKITTSSSDAAKLPNYNDGKELGHSDSVQLGAHVFKFKLSHDDASKMGDNHITNVNFGSGASVTLPSALPKDTVVKDNGSVITKDASSTKSFNFSYGEIEIDVPFSDKPASETASMLAQATITGTVTTDVHSSAASSSVTKAVSKSSNVTIKGGNFQVAIPYRTVEDNVHQTIGIVLSDQKSMSDSQSAFSVNASANANGTASASAQKSGTVSQVVKQSLAFSWKSLLTSFCIHKTDEKGHPLRGVTFELVQSSVADSDVLTGGPGHYTLAQGNGQLISLPKVTDKNGNITWGNLPFGVYTLLEIQTNKGYVMNSNPIDLLADRYHVDEQHEHVINSRSGIKLSLSASGHAGSSGSGSGSSSSVTSSSTQSSSVQIHTSATGTNGTKLVLGAGQQEMTDTVWYKGLTPGKHYVMKGHFVYQDTGKDTGLESSQEFTASSTGEGEVTLTFKGDASKMAGKNIVAFEQADVITSGSGSGATSSTVAVNDNINDSAETLQVTKPEIHTTATVNGAKSIKPSGNVTVTDHVEYSGMVPGVAMDMQGQMHDKCEGKPISGTADQPFTPTQSSGSVDVHIDVDASKMCAKGMVAYEKALQVKPNQVIATHENKNDEGQSIGRISPAAGYGSPSTPTTPTPTTSTSVQRSTETTPLVHTALREAKNNAGLIVAAVGVVTVGAAAIALTKKKKD